MIQKLKKKPVVKRVLQWTGENYEELEQFIKHGDLTPKQGILSLNDIVLNVGDYVIEGSETDYYACAKDSLSKYYDTVDATPRHERSHSERAISRLDNDVRDYFSITEDNKLHIKIQRGPVNDKDKDVNGAQVVNIMEFALNLVRSLDMANHSADNAKTCDLLNLAICVQYDRKFRIANPNIAKVVLDRYIANTEKLARLEDAGVDNWSGYDEAMKLLELESND